MPTKKITDLFAERVKPPAQGRIEFFDAAFGSLALRVTVSGHKSWSLFYRTSGRLRRFKLGNYPALKPKAARREASRVLEKVADGIDPLVERKRSRYELAGAGNVRCRSAGLPRPACQEKHGREHLH